MKTLVLVRPEPGASASLARAVALGISARSVPLFEVGAIAWRAPDPLLYDALFLTSANAVRMGGDELGKLTRLPVFAVGMATAQAARQAGFNVVCTGKIGAEALLATTPPGTRLLHLAGCDVIDSGQMMDRITVYEAMAGPSPDEAVFAGTVVALHSPRAARHLSNIVTRHAEVSLVALSQAVATAAGSGWQRIAVAPVPTDAALLALAAELCLETDE